MAEYSKVTRSITRMVHVCAQNIQEESYRSAYPIAMRQQRPATQQTPRAMRHNRSRSDLLTACVANTQTHNTRANHRSMAYAARLSVQLKIRMLRGARITPAASHMVCTVVLATRLLYHGIICHWPLAVGLSCVRRIPHRSCPQLSHNT